MPVQNVSNNPSNRSDLSTLTHPSASSRRHAQSRRMIATKNLPQDLWLKYRNQGIGSSDAATAVGLNPFKSPLELWMEKTGRIECVQPEMTSDIPLVWGTILEPIVADNYALRTGKKVRKVNAILQHEKHPWMLANLDREIVGDDEVQILECKTAGLYSAKFWRDGVPDYVRLQVLHQLAVTGQQAADVAVLIGGQELQIFRIERDEGLIERLIQLEEAFWQKVISNTPPPADASSSSDRALRFLYPNDNQQTLDLSEDVNANGVFDELLSVKEQITLLQSQESLFKHQLQQSMGDFSVALFSEGKISWKKSTDTLEFDATGFKKSHPTLYEQYLKEKSGSRRFLVQKR